MFVYRCGIEFLAIICRLAGSGPDSSPCAFHRSKGPRERFADRRYYLIKWSNDTMAEKFKDGRIVETADEARQAEPGPSVLLILIVSLVLALGILGTVWLVFFRT
jgi:hypothetical protein